MDLIRRDFLNGAAVSLGSSMLPRRVFASPIFSEDLQPLPADLLPNISEIIPVTLGLLFDASSSVDNEAEFPLQIQGTAQALRSNNVKAAIQRLGAVNVFAAQFGSEAFQTVPHALLRTASDADIFADYILNQKRIDASYTGIANGINVTTEITLQSPYTAYRHVIDISGDGEESRDSRDNYFPMTDVERRDFRRSQYDEDVRQATFNAAINNITVNGLAICTDNPKLDQYYRDTVVTSQKIWDETGVDNRGMVWAISGFQHIARAMESKLVTELAGLPTPAFAPQGIGPIYRFS